MLNVLSSRLGGKYISCVPRHGGSCAICWTTCSRYFKWWKRNGEDEKDDLEAPDAPQIEFPEKNAAMAEEGQKPARRRLLLDPLPAISKKQNTKYKRRYPPIKKTASKPTLTELNKILGKSPNSKPLSPSSILANKLMEEGDNLTNSDAAENFERFFEKILGGNNNGVIHLNSNGNNRITASLTLKSLKPEDEVVVPALPYPTTPLFPGFSAVLSISNRTVLKAIKEIVNGPSPFLGIFMSVSKLSNIINESPEVITDINSIHHVGTYCEVMRMEMAGSVGRLTLIGRSRLLLKSVKSMGPPLMIKGCGLPSPVNDMDALTLEAYSNEIYSYIRSLTSINGIISDWFSNFMRSHERSTNAVLDLADFSGGLSMENATTKQRLLESTNFEERLRLAVSIFEREYTASKVMQELGESVQKKSKEEERKYMLREQMKVIQQELGGDKNPKQTIIDKAMSKVQEMEKCHAPDEAIKTANEEIQRLQYTSLDSAEFSQISNYIDWITCLPWGTRAHDHMNIDLAERILNEDHFGLKDVKDRILEFIAVGKLQNAIPGKVLCLVGPPGTGKTSIAKSVAHALGREYYQFSVGGMNDVAQIKGHRRTYIGSMPGKLIHCLKKTKVNNPMILIDEVDKMTPSHQGDPASALLEVLDPNQNNSFVDNYLDIPVDFSQALFICTANDTSTIPQPLLDRMEVIRVSGYDYMEKMSISKQYLDKKARISTGLEKSKQTTPPSLNISDDALEDLIRYYCREAGVRNLEKYIEKIFRKSAMKIARLPADQLSQTDFTITSSNLHEYVGKKIFLSDRLYDKTPPGVVMGLAWTSLGGATLYIECQTLLPHPLDTTINLLQRAMIRQNDYVLSGVNVNEKVMLDSHVKEDGAPHDPVPTDDSNQNVFNSSTESSDDSDAVTPSQNDNSSHHPPLSDISHTPTHSEVVVDVNSASAKVKSDAMVRNASPCDRCNTPSNTNTSTQQPTTTHVGGGGGKISTTGQLGDVMKESVHIAYINARHWMKKLAFSKQLSDNILKQYHMLCESRSGALNESEQVMDGSSQYASDSLVHPLTSPLMSSSPSLSDPNMNEVFSLLEDRELHLHLPEGATPKDGPSAGCAITTSILSIAINRPVKQGLAMTGEISLNGKVLAVGGIKEKVIAARRAGVNEVILPAENSRDVEELPEYIRDNLTVHYAREYEDVLRFTELCPEIFEK